MTKMTIQTPEYDEFSSLPDASDIDTMANDFIASESGNHLFLPNADDASDSDYFDGNSNIMTSVYQESSDRPSFSNLDDSEYHESSSGTATPIRQEVTDQSRLSGAGEVDVSGNLESDSNALTPGNYHVIDEYSFLSDAPDARDMETSRTFETAPRVSTPNQLQIYNQSFLPDASEVSDTTIKMESPQASTSGSRSLLQETSDFENPGRLTESYVRREAVENSKISPHSTKTCFPDNRFDGNRQPLLPQRRWQRSGNSYQLWHGTRAPSSPSWIVAAEQPSRPTVCTAIRRGPLHYSR